MLEAGVCVRVVRMCMYMCVPACILCGWVHACQCAHVCAIVWGGDVRCVRMHVWLCVCVCVCVCTLCVCVCVIVCACVCVRACMYACISTKKFGTKKTQHTVSSYSVTSQFNVLKKSTFETLSLWQRRQKSKRLSLILQVSDYVWFQQGTKLFDVHVDFWVLH